MIDDNNYSDTKKMLRKMDNANKGIYEDLSDLKPIKFNKPQTMRESLKLMREAIETSDKEKTTERDMRDEEDRMQNFFAEQNVHIEFKVLDVFDNSVFAGGVINRQIQFIYKISTMDGENGVKIETLDDFNEKDPNNGEIIKKIESYYDTFYKYWEDNILSD